MVNTYTVLDIETTGISAAHNAEILEVAAYHTDGITISDYFHEYIKPWNKIPKKTIEINHITEDMVKDKANKFVVLPRLRKFIGDTTVVAHNATFDFNFINIELFRIGQPLLNKYICTQKSFKKFFPKEKSNLANVADVLGISLEDAHSALGDTKATTQVFIELLKMGELETSVFTDRENIINTLSRIVKGPPHKVQTEIMTTVPKSTSSTILTDEIIFSKFMDGATPHDICSESANGYKDTSEKFISWMNMIRYAKFIKLTSDKKVYSEVKAMVGVSDSFTDLLKLHKKIYGTTDANLSIYSVMWAILKNKDNMKYSYDDFVWQFTNRKSLLEISNNFSIAPFMVADYFIEFAQKNKEEYRDYITANICSKKELKAVLSGEDFINVVSGTPNESDIRKYISKKLYNLGFFKIVIE